MSSPPSSPRPKTRTLSVELPESVVKLLGPTVRAVTWRLVELAFVELFRQGEVSSGWAARQLNIGKDDFLDLLIKHGVPYVDMTAERLI